jgi:hypothetical protein
MERSALLETRVLTSLLLSFSIVIRCLVALGLLCIGMVTRSEAVCLPNMTAYVHVGDTSSPNVPLRAYGDCNGPSCGLRLRHGPKRGLWETLGWTQTKRDPHASRASYGPAPESWRSNAVGIVQSH